MPTYKSLAVKRHLDELTVTKDAKLLVSKAKLRGAPNVHVPVWLLEQLIERATRPHD